MDVIGDIVWMRYQILYGCHRQYCMGVMGDIVYNRGGDRVQRGREGGEKEMEDGVQREREREVNKKRGEKAEERVEGEISRRGSGRGWKVERDEGREREKWDRGQRRRERQTERDKWCKVESEGWRKWGRQKTYYVTKMEGMRGMGEKRK